MKAIYRIGWKYVLGLLLLPLAAAFATFLTGKSQGYLRFNPAYFTEEYTVRYSALDHFVDDFEQAIVTGDVQQLTILHGTRNPPRDAKPQPHVQFAIFWQKDGDYLEYLFFDIKTYDRFMKHIKFTNGRYIVVQEDLYYYIDSGRWLQFFVPLTAIWWGTVLVFTGGVWVYRAMADFRKNRFGGRTGQ